MATMAFDSFSMDSTSSYVSRASREELLKKRFASLIQKSQKTLEKAEGRTTTTTSDRCCKKVTATEKMKQMRNGTELQKKELRRKAEIQKKREASRREIEQMRNTSGMGDPQQVMRDFEKLIGYNPNAESTTHVSLTPYGSNTLLFKFAEVTGLKGSAKCYDKYKESLRQTKNPPTFVKRTENCRGQVKDVANAKKAVVEEVEEGEITD